MSPKLENIIGITQQQAKRISMVSKMANQDEILATLCAVVFLKTKLADEEEVWEFIVTKAESWLEEQTKEAMADLERSVMEARLFSASAR